MELKKIIACILLISLTMLACSGTYAADSLNSPIENVQSSVPEVSWNFKNGVLTFSGTGEIGGYSKGSKEAPWVSILDDVTEIVFSEGITTISGLCLYNNAKNTNTVYIPKSVESINSRAFARMSSLTEFVVDSENEVYTADDGVLYSKDMKTILQYPRGTSG